MSLKSLKTKAYLITHFSSVFLYHLKESEDFGWFSGKSLGKSSLADKSIYVAKDLTEEEQLIIFIHEILHFVLDHPHRAFRVGVCSPEQANLWNICADYVVNRILLALCENFEFTKEREHFPSFRLKETFSYAEAFLRDTIEFSPEEEFVEALYLKLRRVAQSQGSAMLEGYSKPLTPFLEDLASFRPTGILHSPKTYDFVTLKARLEGVGILSSDFSEEWSRAERRFDFIKYIKKVYSHSMNKTFNRTYRKPSKYNLIFPNSSLLMPGRARKPRLKVGVIIDTSGSMSTYSLECITSVVNYMVSKSQIRLIQVDSEIKFDEDINSKNSMEDIKVLGRGGTDLVPAFNRMEEDSQIRNVFVFTDGQVFHWPSSVKKDYIIVTELPQTLASLPRWGKKVSIY